MTAFVAWSGHFQGGGDKFRSFGVTPYAPSASAQAIYAAHGVHPNSPNGSQGAGKRAASLLRASLVGLAHGTSHSGPDLALYIAYKEWLNIAYRQWQAEMDLFKRRLAAYDGLKSAVGGAGASAGAAASPVDTERFAQAMSDMRFLFDEDVERFVSGLYDAALKKHALDALLEKVNGHGKAPADQALIEQAFGKSRELASQISNGIYREMPEHIEKFMRRRPSRLRITRRGRRHCHRLNMRDPNLRNIPSQARSARIRRRHRNPGQYRKLSGLRVFCNNSKRFAG